MNIYFAGSIRGGRDDAERYSQIIAHLKGFGTVLTEHVGDKGLSSYGENNLTEEDIHKRDLDWMFASDVIVAEVSTPSLGVGYEIGRAIEHHKRILCLYRLQEGRKLSAMIKGSPDITLIEYDTAQDAITAIDEFFNEKN